MREQDPEASPQGAPSQGMEHLQATRWEATQVTTRPVAPELLIVYRSERVTDAYH